VNINGILNF